MESLVGGTQEGAQGLTWYEKHAGEHTQQSMLNVEAPVGAQEGAQVAANRGAQVTAERAHKPTHKAAHKIESTALGNKPPRKVPYANPEVDRSH